MSNIPSFPRLLGLAGLLPQFAFVAALLWQPEGMLAGFAKLGALIYAALILSFLGGTWWGIAASAPAAERRKALGWLWIASVLPSLIAFVAILWPLLGPLHGHSIEPALVAMAGGLWVALAVDLRIAALAPPWWLQLRAPLSIFLGAATLAAAIL
jgi:hypothetical protein